MKVLSLALGFMFMQQTFVTLGKVLPAVIAPAILFELRIDPSWLGVYVGIIAAMSLVVQAGCGSIIVRYGALRISQVALLMTGLGLVLALPGLNVLLFLSAVAIGVSASSTPASSHLLGRYAPIKYAPLIFSIKQTAVPVGLLTAGLAGPLLTESLGWRNALLSVAGGCILFAAVLEIMRNEFDSDRNKARKFQLGDFKGTISTVLCRNELRSLALGCFAFVGLQTTFIAYFVIHLTKIGFSLLEAGTIFSVATAVAIPGRIFWGWLSSTFINPRVMLGLLALLMAVAVTFTSMLSANWAILHVGFVAICVSATVFSWHGVTLSEAARLAPASMRGTVTGGVLSFGQFGGLVLPLIFSLCLSTTGSYQVGFLVCGTPALAVGILLLQSARFKIELNKS